MARVQDYLDRQRQEADTQEVGIGGFTALARINERYNLSADAPVTPVENGSFVNDHIILKPLVLTIEGDVSDVHRRESPSIKQLKRLQAEIGNVASQYAPALTTSQIARANALTNDALDAVRRIDNLLDTGGQILDYLGNQDDQTKSIQEQFKDAMEALFFGKQIFAIDMPFRRHENMVITDLIMVTDNEIDSTGFQLTAQQVRFAESLFVSTPTPSAGLNGQTENQTSKGTQEGTPVEQSFFTQAVNGLTGG